MRKIVIVFFLSLLPIAFVFPQTGVTSDCEANLDNIFHIFILRDKYEIVKYIHSESQKRTSPLFIKNSDMLKHYFTFIKGFPLQTKKQEDSISATEPEKLVKVEYMSKEEINRYIEELNYTPLDAHKDYSDFIRNMVIEKELYMLCVDAELAKGNESEYAKGRIHYDFMKPMMSVMTPWITKLDFLKVFKEFILNDGELFLPEYFRVKAYLERGCKLPPY
ncbi:MAG: hypothetical protein PHI32_10785 [Dysgonamonadaceae bacterium]|nr:hypothetical protein [Dysgonamonadaceae bacterium]